MRYSSESKSELIDFEKRKLLLHGIDKQLIALTGIINSHNWDCAKIKPENELSKLFGLLDRKNVASLLSFRILPVSFFNRPYPAWATIIKHSSTNWRQYLLRYSGIGFIS